MADEFKTYDKRPIVGVVNVSKWSFAVREIIVAICALVFLIFFLLFAGLFATSQSDLESCRNSAKNAANTKPDSGGSSPQAVPYCTSAGCLRTATRAIQLMNKSVDPCDNFYEFACGNYKTTRPIFLNEPSKNVKSDIYLENEERQIKVLETPISTNHDFSSERKAKEFFQSCNDMYTRQKNGGKPFLDQVVSTLGGWKVLGTWDQNSWDLNDALKRVHGDFITDAIWAPKVSIDYSNGNTPVISIGIGGLGKWMAWAWYTDPNNGQYKTHYRNYVKRVGSYLLRDATGQPLQDATQQQTYLEEFVNDTIAVEETIARLASTTGYETNPYAEENKVSLQDLTTQTGNVISWVDQLSYLYNQAGITGSTKVVIQRKEYIGNVTQYISSLPDANRKRMMHNYLIWRVAENYIEELSYEYMQANREVYEDLRGAPNFMDNDEKCFNTIQIYMQDALSFLFIKEHLGGEGKDTVKDITVNIKAALKSQLDKTPWMDPGTRAFAKDKLDKIIFKMGYPDWMSNQGTVDNIYTNLNINASDFFGNMINANRLKKDEWNRQLTQGENRQNWDFAAYGTIITLRRSWNEIIAPAGMLQFPIYDRAQPHYATFGSLGTLLGQNLHDVIDESGRWYSKTGTNMSPNTWWSDQTVTNYVPIKTCVQDLYSNVSKDYLYPDGTWRTLNINAGYYATMGMSYTNGIRLAQIAYKDWLNNKQLVEQTLPGLNMTNEQLIFLTHAQTYCYSRTPAQSLNMGTSRVLEEDTKVNYAFGQLPEFSAAFKCRAGSKMNHAKKCDYY